jgi:hypothetical protein
VADVILLTERRAPNLHPHIVGSEGRGHDRGGTVIFKRIRNVLAVAALVTAAGIPAAGAADSGTQTAPGQSEAASVPVDPGAAAAFARERGIPVAEARQRLA